MLRNLIPTATQTPDAGQGGAAVTGIVAQGHGSTTSTANGPAGSTTKTARWFTFTPNGGQILSITLKADFSVTGSLVIAVDADNLLTIDYSTNGGGGWNNALTRSSVTSLENGSISVGLSAGQVIANVQVRDRIEASATEAGDSASITVSISNIRLEVNLADGRVMMIGM